MALQKISLLGKIASNFILGFLLIALVHGLDYNTSEKLIDSFRQVQQVQQTILRLEETASSLKDVLQAHRGYILSEQEALLEPYYAARTQLPEQIQQLEQEMQDHPGYTEELAKLEDVTARKLQFVDRTIADVRGGNRQKARDEIFLGKEFFDDALQLINSLQAREQAHLDALRQQAEENAVQNRRVIIIAFIVSALLVLFALQRIASEVAKTKLLQSNLEWTNKELKSNNEELLTTNQLLADNERKLMEIQQALERTNTEMGTFSYSISHDLRAPLRAISGYSTILEEELGEKLGDEGRKLTTIIRTNANRMGTLINGLLEFAKLGKKAVYKHPLDSNALVKQVLAEKTLKAGTRLTIARMEPAMADASLLRQVWENLITNAIKFSSLRDVPEINITYRREFGRQIFCVQDNGIGFDPAYADQLFGVFKRLHADEDFEGSGVGLAIAKRIVEAHGGEIWAQGYPREGATFCFSLPVAEEAQ